MNNLIIMPKLFALAFLGLVLLFTPITYFYTVQPDEEALRNSNSILDKIEQTKIKTAAAEAKGEIIEEEVTGEIEPVEVGREKLSAMIAKSEDA